MAQKRTDWEVMRALADWVADLGLEQSQHLRFFGKREVAWGETESYLNVYWNGRDYVSLDVCVDGVEVLAVNILGKEVSIEKVALSEELPMITDVAEKALTFDARTFSALVRKELNFLVKQKAERIKAQKVAKIERLKEEAKNLEAEITGLEK